MFAPTLPPPAKRSGPTFDEVTRRIDSLNSLLSTLVSVGVARKDTLPGDVYAMALSRLKDLLRPPE